MLKTNQCEALYERASRTLATGVSTGFRRHVTPVPLYFERADGPYYFTVEGEKLLDYGLAWGPLILGNNHPKLNEAVQKQLGIAYTCGGQHLGEIELAELMTRVIPGAEQVIFANTGSEAVQAALRLARGYTGRSKVIKFEGHYHGWHNNILVSVHPAAEQLGTTSGTCGGQPAEEFGHTIALPWNDLGALESAFREHRDQIACVITEPILVNAGSCMPNDGYLHGLIDLCRQNGAVSIFDEVITGFRIALGGAREYFGVEPDLSTYAKAMAGGFSMAGVAGRRDIFDALSDGRTVHFGTYNGNPICIAATIASIKVLSEPGTYERMHGHGNAIRQAIEKAAAACGHTLVTSGTGTAFSVHFDLHEQPRNWADVLKADSDKYDRFRAAMLQRHIHLLPEGRWYVGAVHGRNELDIVLPAIDESMKDIQ